MVSKEWLVHLSVFMGPVSFGASNDLARIEQCLDEAIRCADEGFAMVTFGEQHFNGYEPYSNPFLMAARLSPHLGDTWFGTTVVPPAFHNPLLLAEEASIVDLLLRGRFVMGTSHGRTGPVPEWKMFGLDQADRDEIFSTKLDHFHRMVTRKAGDPPLVMATQWDRGEVVGRMMPLAWRAGGPQVAIGSSTDETILDVARRGLPLFMSPVRMPVAAAKLARYHDELAAAGYSDVQQAHARRLSMITVQCVVGATDEEAWDNAEVLVGGNPMMDRSNDPRSMRELAAVDEQAIADGTDASPRNSNWVNSWMMVGSPDSITERLRGYGAIGFEHVNIRFMAGMSRPDLVARSHDLFTREVLPHIDSQLFPALRDDEIEPEHSSAPSAPDLSQGPGGGDFATRNLPQPATR